MKATSLLLFAACNTASTTPDSTTTPATIHVSGHVTMHDASALPADLTVALRRLDDDSLVASTLPATSGAFEMTFPNQGSAPGDIYLVSSSSSLVPTYFNFTSFVTADTYAPVELFTPAAYGALYTAAGINPTATTGTIEILGPDGTNQYRSDGAGTVVYADAHGTPDPSATSSSLAYVLDAASGSISMDTPDGRTVSSREIRTFPTSISMIIIPPPIGGD